MAGRRGGFGRLAQPSPEPASAQGPQPRALPAAPAAESFAAGVKAFDQGKHREAFMLWLPLPSRARPKRNSTSPSCTRAASGSSRATSRRPAGTGPRPSGAMRRATEDGKPPRGGRGRPLGPRQRALRVRRGGGGRRQGFRRGAAGTRSAGRDLPAHKIEPEDVTAFDGGRYACASSCATIFLGGTERVLWGARGHRTPPGRLDARCRQTGGPPVCHDGPRRSIVALRRYVRFMVRKPPTRSCASS